MGGLTGRRARPSDALPGAAPPALPRLELEDPAGKGLEQVRRIRDAIERHVRELIADLGVGAART